MNMPDSFLSTLRQEAEESWRQRLDEAHNRYQIATARYRGLLEKAPERQVHCEDDPLALARDAESETLAEYARLLKIVTDLERHGGKRETQSRVRTAGGKT